MSGGPPRGINDGSKFWTRLSEGHRQNLEQFGINEIKRRQALEYFNWRFRPEHLHLNDQAAFLREHTSRWQQLGARARLRTGHRDWAGLDWSTEERRVYAYYTRLLWSYAKQHGDRLVTVLSEPAIGSPLPIFDGRRLVSQDLANSALEVAAVREALGPDEPSKILEVGAGYGRNAFALLSVFPAASYVIVDIEPARTISEWYLGQLFPDRSVACVTPGEFIAAADWTFDLALSISSLHEMTFAQLGEYLQLFDKRVNGVVYLKQWTEWTNPDDEITSRFADYPIPSSWKPIFMRPCPVQTLFTEAAWRVG